MNTKRALLTIGEVADELGCCKATVYNLMQRNFPRPVKIGPRAVRWHRIEVQKWIDSQPRG